MTSGTVSPALAARLKAAGLRWRPDRGDAFVLPDRGLDHLVFVLSDLTVDVQEVPSGRVIGFNGTVEWALDSVQLDEALWLPREDQVRALLGAAFRRLEPAGDGFAVVATGPDGSQVRAVADGPAEAYALVLLALHPDGFAGPGD